MTNRGAFNAELLRHLREEAGWTREDMAAELRNTMPKCSRQLIEFWESGKVIPGGMYLVAIASLFDIQPIDLLISNNNHNQLVN